MNVSSIRLSLQLEDLMVDPFTQELWEERFRDGLTAVRDAIWAGDHVSVDEARQEERRALREVAAHPAFAGLGPAIEATARGRWITARTAKAVRTLAAQLPPTAVTAVGQPADKAVLLWDRALQEGLRPDELAREFPALFDARPRQRRDPSTALKMRIRAVMWLRGNTPLARARAGIEKLYYAVTTALQLDSGSGPPTLAEASFYYEWDRLWRDAAREQRQLVTLLSFIAPSPLTLTMLRDGWEALPSPLRKVVTDQTSLAQLVTTLAERGLVAADLTTVTCSAPTQELVRSQLSQKSQATACAFAVRFLRAALPLDTHFHGSWRTWRQALPHVEAATRHADRLSARLADAARLLDRKAVFHLDADYDAEAAIADSLRAIDLADRAGRPDAEHYAIYLANYAIALRQAERLDDAIDAMDRSLQFHRDRLGTDDEEYASSLSIKAAMLSAGGRYQQAEQAHRESLETIRAVVARPPEPYVIGKLIEILNDYAAHLLRPKPGRTQGDVEAALGLLDEALTRVKRGEYGWRQVMANRARAWRLVGDLDAAEATYRDLVEYCEQAYGDPSYELYAALRDLADLLKERGSPDYHAVYLRAHEVDDAVGPDAPSDPDDPIA
jgi:tetratricopeptide (TPR) repeat protein